MQVNRVTFGETQSNQYVGYLRTFLNFIPSIMQRVFGVMCSHYEYDETEQQGRIHELLDLVGLADTTSLVSTYSRGMKQRTRNRTSTTKPP